LAFHSGREADHSQVKEWVELYLHSPNTPSWHGAQLGGAQGQLYFYLTHLALSLLVVAEYYVFAFIILCRQPDTSHCSLHTTPKHSGGSESGTDKIY
jgi:hypothetical protein